MFSVEDIVLQVKMKISFREVQTPGVLKDEMEICVWDLTYALALSPQICSLEPETIVKTLCSDGPLGHYGSTLQHILFDIQPTNPLTFTQAQANPNATSMYSKIMRFPDQNGVLNLGRSQLEN